MAKRVLIAEDYDDIRGMMKFFIEHLGYEVLEAGDGYQAVQKAVSGHPDLIFMDIAMPIMDGIQASQAIRRHPELNDVPILCLTGYSDFYCVRARDVGCNDVLQKPVDLEHLGSVMRRYFADDQQVRAAAA